MPTIHPDRRRDGRLLAIWIGVNALGCVVIVVGGVVLELLASDMTRKLTGDHQL
jgi:hypothetical protein